MSNSKFFSPTKITLTDVNGKQHDLTSAVGLFSYYENIYIPFVSANMFVVDSGQNFIGNLPIQGGEKINVSLENVKKEKVEYDLVVWKVYNRNFEKNMQYYTLSLISEEGLLNQSARVIDNYQGNAEAIVSSVLKNVLKTKKKLRSETSQFKMNLCPNGRKAHAFIQSLSPKTVSKTTKFKKGGGSNSSSQGSELGVNSKKASGTAGYLFFENKEGFVFESIDRLCSDGTDTFGGSPPIAEYVARPGIGSNPDTAFYNIIEYKFVDEIDIVDKLNNGIFSTHMCYFDISSQKYEEYNYDMKKTFNNMSHLGSQDILGKYQKQLSEKPSRIMSILLDHESWYSGENIANPEENGDADFPDHAKYYTAQSIGRRYLMEMQKLEIEISGNSDLKVGDKIKVMLPNMAAQSIRESKKYDEENSGTYLISSLAHHYQIMKESGEPEFISQLTLIRDTMGIKEYDSNVK